MDNIVKNINYIYGTLTKSEKKIAKYLMDNIHEAQYLSISSLAQKCAVAEATITRFCRKLGLIGYNNLKLSLAKDDSNNENDFHYTQSENADDAFALILNREISSLIETHKLIDAESCQRAVHYLNSAQRVYCMGQGSSGVIAMEAWSKFVAVAPQFQYIMDSHFQAMTAALTNINDVIIYFSYSGSTRDIIDVLSLAKQKHAKIILITRYADCPAAQYADVVLLSGVRENPLESGSIPARISQLFIIDILFSEYCALNSQLTAQNLDMTTESLSGKHL